VPMLNQEGEPPRKGEVRAFEGVSEFRHTSNAESLHEAIQQAAEAAVEGLSIAPGDTRVFEVTRIQVEVGGNPNVKIYRVEMSDRG
jgi:flavin-binding protein dodecin